MDEKATPATGFGDTRHGVALRRFAGASAWRAARLPDAGAGGNVLRLGIAPKLEPTPAKRGPPQTGGHTAVTL
jgi:hypothetical protein